jgi:hypothetical protein
MLNSTQSTAAVSIQGCCPQLLEEGRTAGTITCNTNHPLLLTSTMPGQRCCASVMPISFVTPAARAG